MNHDGHDPKPTSPSDSPPGGLTALAASKTWPEVPSAIGRSEGLAARARDSGSFTHSGASAFSGLTGRPFRAAYRAPDRNFEALCARALGLAECGRLEDALRIALVCIEEEPLHHAGYVVAAEIQERRGRFAEAEVLVERALVIAPDLVDGASQLDRIRNARPASGGHEPRGPRARVLSA